MLYILTLYVMMCVIGGIPGCVWSSVGLMYRGVSATRVRTLKKEYLSNVVMIGHRSRIRAEHMLYALIEKVDGEPLRSILLDFVRDLKRSNWTEHEMIGVHLDACKEVDGHRYEEAFYKKEVAKFERVQWIHVPFYIDQVTTVVFNM